MFAFLRVLAESSIRSVVVAALIAALLAALRIRAGGVRHAAWAAVLGAMLLLPVLPRCVPAIDVPLGFAEPLPEAAPALPTVEVRLQVRADIGEARPGGAPPAAAQPSATPGLPAGPPIEPFWPTAVAIAYAAGALALGTRLGCGGLGAARLVRSSPLIPPPDLGEVRGAPDRTPFRESSQVAAPVTVGLCTPVVILPIEWRQWPESTLRAALAHERAHVRRRDTLTAFLARINCAVFWFHPLAWWLERRLAATAEQACDEAVVERLGDPRAYAALLVDMAAAVHNRGRRFSGHGIGIGIGGSGLLAERIECILRGEFAGGASRARKGALAAASLAVILGVAACHRGASPSDDPNRRGLSSRRQGEQYAEVLVGKYTRTGHHALRALVNPQPDGPRANEARRALAESNDDVLLTAAARTLVRSPRAGALGIDPDDLARSCLERALQLNPRSIAARVGLLQIERARRTDRLYQSILRKAPLASQHEAVAALPEADRFELLPELALAAFRQAEGAASMNDANLDEYVRRALENSRRYAEDVLALAPLFRADPRYGDALYKAHMALGSLAFREGQTKVAVEHLRKASASPATEEWAYAQGIEGSGLLEDLLRAGERAAVIDFLEQRAETTVVLRERLRDIAMDIRAGQTPRLGGWEILVL
jgi:hypothetical protein